MELHIQGINSQGQGIGRLDDGRVVFCTGALPDENVDVRLVVQKKSYAVAELQTVTSPHPERVEPQCRWYGRCGGCQLQHASRRLQLELKSRMVADALVRLGGFSLKQPPASLASPVQWGYRNKASFPVRRSDEGADIGFFRAGSHDLVPIETCPLVCDSAAQLYGKFRKLVRGGGFSAYDERTGRGWLRHLVIRASVFGQGLLAMMVVTSRPDAEGLASLRDLWSYLRREHPALTGLTLNINAEPGNRITGEQTVTVAGDDQVMERLGAFKLHYDGTSFFQVNTAQATRLFEYAASLNQGAIRTLELYGGVGALTAFLARSSSLVTAVEIWPPAVELARTNMAHNDLTNVSLNLSPAEELPQNIFERQETVVVDPPRTGCDRRLLERIVASDARKMIYVSCNPATLARDGAFLRDHGFRFEEETMRAFDMFPQTCHVETVVRFSRERSD